MCWGSPVSFAGWFDSFGPGSSARAARVAHVAALVLSAGLYERRSVADKGFFIERLPREGTVTFLALVKEKELRKKRDGGFYLHLLLGDRTGELDAKVWDKSEETAALFQRDEIVKVRGVIEIYHDRPQLVVKRIRRCEASEF